MHLLTLVYSCLAFAEILVLFASIIGLLTFAVRQLIAITDALLSAAIDAGSRNSQPRDKRPNTFNLMFEGRPRRILGGHNEPF